MDADSRLMLEVVVPAHNEQDTLDAITTRSGDTLWTQIAG